MIDSNELEKEKKYKFINRKKVCSNSKFNVFFDHVISPDNKEIRDFLIVKPKVSVNDHIVGICVLPIYKNKFCLMNGWRHQFDEFIIQAPAGFVEPEEEPEITALRELEEETSLICKEKDLIALGNYLPDAGLIEGRVALYLAKNCIKSDAKNDYEIGMSEISYYSESSLKKILFEQNNIGGSTFITCYRALLYMSHLDH